MNCILCSNSQLKLYTKDSYLHVPVFFCNNCNLYISGDSEENLSRKIKEFYANSYWDKKDISTEEAIKSNYSDTNSQGKRRQWISQFEFCKPYIMNKKKFQEFLNDSDNPKWEKIATAGRKYVLDELNNDRAVDSLVDLMEELI